MVDKKILNTAFKVGNKMGSEYPSDYFTNSVGDVFIKDPNCQEGIVIFSNSRQLFLNKMPQEWGFSSFK